MMKESDFQKIKEIFSEVVEVPASEQNDLLKKLCGDDSFLFDEVKSLLDSHNSAEKVIEKHALDFSSLTDIKPQNYEGIEFGHYKIICEIGHGGMGAVFLAERNDGEFNQKVALKIVRQTVVTNELERYFRRERQILASLNHPNIAKLLDGGVSERGEPFLAMEYVEGETLAEFAEKRNLSINEKLKLFLKICDAVQYAHRNLTIHRDIKPTNILVTENGEPKLLDFGLAKIFDESLSDENQTATVFRAFTPAYASPEQIFGKQVTTVSDVYSLGVVLYELLTNEKPFHFDGKSLEEIIKTISDSEPQLPSTINFSKHDANNPKLKGDLDNISLKALQKNPERRYQSVEEFASDIERHLNGLPVLARPTTFFYKVSKFIGRNKISVSAAMAVFLSLILGLAIVLWQSQIARRQRDLAQSEREKSEQINKFLQQMLAFSNQSYTSISPVAKSKNVTVNEMLDQITPTIETELANQPEVRAKILRTIGSSYASQGYYEKAEKNLRSALNTQLEIYGEENPETADTMIQLGVLTYRQSKFEDSLPLLEKSVNFYRKYYAENSQKSAPKFIQSLDFLSVNKFYSGDTNTAISLFEEGMNVASNVKLNGNEREVFASLQMDFGVILARLGNTQKGEDLIHAGVALYSEISDKPRWEVGNAKAGLAFSFINRNELELAEKELSESESIIRETLGDKTMYLASTLKMKAILFTKKNDLKTAEKAARESFNILQEILPMESPFTAGAMVTLGTVLTKSNKLPEGEKYLTQAKSIYDKQPKKNFAFIVPNVVALTENFISQNRLNEAEKLATETLKELKQTFDAENQLVKDAEMNLAKVYEKQGKKLATH